jgi:uncharacterized protein YgbK (DUF1537 family)
MERRTGCVASRRVLVVVGSRHEVNVAQVDRLQHILGPRFAFVQPQRDSLGLTPTVDTAVLLPSAGGRTGGDGPGADSVADALARQAVELIDRQGFDGLIVTGGETAAAVVRQARAERVDLLDEIEPGVALGRMQIPRPVALVTKAGGFGDRETLVRLRRHFTEGTRRCASR